MPPRLSALDASFLYLEQPTHADARRRGVDLPAAEGRLRLRPARRAHRAADRAGAALPAEDPARARQPGPAGVGRRPRLRRHLPRAPLGAAQAGLGRAAHRAGRPADVAPARPHPAAVGDVPGRGPGRWPGSPCSPRPTRRWSTASARSTSARCILDVSPEPRGPPEELWMPRPEPTDVAAGAATRSPRPSPGPARSSTTCAPPRATRSPPSRKVVGGAGGLLRRPRTASRGRPRARPLNVADLHPAPVRRSPGPSWRTTARSARAHGGTVNDVVLAVVAGALRNWLLSRGEPVTSSTTVRAMVPLSVRGRGRRAQLDRHGLARQPGLVLPRGPAGRRAQPGGAAAPGGARDARAHGGPRQSVGADALVRIGGFAPPTLHALGARAASGFSRADLQPRGDERAGPAVPALRRRRADAGDVPGGAAGEGPGAGDRPHRPTTAASTTASTATATRWPTSTCWPAWSTSRSTNCWGRST